MKEVYITAIAVSLFTFILIFIIINLIFNSNNKKRGNKEHSSFNWIASSISCLIIFLLIRMLLPVYLANKTMEKYQTTNGGVIRISKIYSFKNNNRITIPNSNHYFLSLDISECVNVEDSKGLSETWCNEDVVSKTNIFSSSEFYVIKKITDNLGWTDDKGVFHKDEIVVWLRDKE